MNNNGTDSTLGGQGNSDFTSMIAPGGAPSTQQAPSPSPQMRDGTLRKSVQEFEAGEAARGGQPPQGEPGQEQLGGEQPAGGEQTLEGGGEQPAGEGGEQQPAGQQPTTPPQSQADLIRAAVEATANALTGQQRQSPQQQAPTPEMTPQEFASKYKVVQVTPQDMTILLGQDPVASAKMLTDKLQGAVQQGILMGMDINKAEIGRLESTFKPHIDSWSQHKAEIEAKASYDRFYKVHPQLQKEHDLVVDAKDALLARVRSGQLTFRSEAEAFAAVATAVNKVIQRFRTPGNGQGAPSDGGQQSQTQLGAGQGNNRRMSAASSAGRSGTGKAAAKSVVDSVFGADAR